MRTSSTAWSIMASGLWVSGTESRWTLQVKLVRRWLERIREQDHQAFAGGEKHGRLSPPLWRRSGQPGGPK